MKKISEEITDLEDGRLQITLPCPDNNQPQAYALPFYGYKWVCLSKKQLEKIAKDYLQYISKQEGKQA